MVSPMIANKIAWCILSCILGFKILEIPPAGGYRDTFEIVFDLAVTALGFIFLAITGYKLFF